MSSENPIDVEVIDFATDPKLLQEAAAYYCSLSEDRKSWPDDKRRRIVIRTECRWGRIGVGESVFMLNEKGGGLKTPLSSSNRVGVHLYAELRPSAPGAGDGFIEQAPFCKVDFDDIAAKRLKTMGMVHLADFLSKQIANFKQTHDEWIQIIQATRQKVLAFRQAQKAPAKKSAIPAEAEEGPAGPRP